MPPKLPARKLYSFWMNATEAASLKRVKAAQGTTESEQIRQALRDWFTKKGVGPTKTARPTRGKKK